MNDVLLSERLRALRQPPPNDGFEARLALALRRAADAESPHRGSAAIRSGRRVRRWASRLSLGMALSLGASAAAAAAGGVWAFVARPTRQLVPPPSTVPPANPKAERAPLPHRAAPAPAPAPSEMAAPEPSAGKAEETPRAVGW